MPRTFWTSSSRGRRPRGDSYKERRTLEYLAIVAMKHNIKAREFLDCIKEAYDQEESECKKLSVVCRQKTEDSGIFLFTVEQDVVAQFPVSTGIFQREKQLESARANTRHS